MNAPNKVIITDTKNYIILKIPKETVMKDIPSGGKKELTQTQALRIFTKARNDYTTGKLKGVYDLNELL